MAWSLLFLFFPARNGMDGNVSPAHPGLCWVRAGSWSTGSCLCCSTCEGSVSCGGISWSSDSPTVSCICSLHAWLSVVMEMGFRNGLSPVWSSEVSVPSVVHQQSPAARPVFPPVDDPSLSAEHCFETWGGDNPARRRLWQHKAPFQGQDDFLLISPGSTSRFKGLPSN